MAEEPKEPKTPDTEKPKDGKKTRTPIETWSKTTLDLVAAAANSVNELKDSKKQPAALLVLARSFDSLSARCAREAVLIEEAEGPRQINPLVEITSINMASALRGTARELEQGKGQPATWEKTADDLGTQVKIAKAAHLIISQTGAAATVSLPGEPLKGEDGKPLVKD